MDETGLYHWLGQGLKLNRKARVAGRIVGFASHDGRAIYEVKPWGRGVRELRDGIMQLAQMLSEAPGVERAYLLIGLGQSSPARIREEWARALAAFKPEVAGRLRLVAVVEGKIVTAPGGAEVETLAQQFKRFTEPRDRPGDDQPGRERAFARRVHGVRWKPLEVEKVLVNRWLTGAGPITTKELERTVGCSYPVVRAVVDRLSGRGIIGRRRGRMVELTRYRGSDWAGLLSAMSAVYPAREYVDATGHGGAVEGLLGRLRRRAPGYVALGGVPAARFWDPELDLHGTPRVDVVVHLPEDAAEGGANPGERGDFVERLDPALRPREGAAGRGSAVLVVHPIRRREALFERGAGEPVAWAGPVETVHHLRLMGLAAQADAMVSKLTGGREGR